MIRYDPGSGTFRGPAEAIASLRDRLASADPSDLPALLAETEVDGLDSDSDALVEAIAVALGSPLFTVTLTVSGPGGHHEHDFDIGINAAAVRHSPVRADISELNGFPMTMLPGAVARFVRFRPGTPPAEDVAPIRVPARVVGDLGAPGAETRAQAWSEVEPLLARAGYRDEEDPSWQLVQSHAAWTATDGQDSEDLSVHLRSASHHLVAVQSDEEMDLVPVPSITAWETLIQVLPGAHEVRRPA